MKKLFLILPLMALSACGGSSSSDSPETSKKNTGVFVDSPVINIGYKTETLDGVTNAQGQYEYINGETITFFIGDLKFPSTLAKDLITPLDLAKTTNLTHPTVVNMIRLLQTLDQDGKASNGINITDAAKNKATAVDFNSSISDFSNSDNVTALIMDAGQSETIVDLISSIDAVSHFGQSLELIYNEQENVDIADEYTVYGGNEPFVGGSSNMKNYTLLGKAKGIEEFSGSYKYYAITNKNETVTIQIDAVQGSNDIYYSTNFTSNTVTGTGETAMNLDGAPDENYVSIARHGYILINVSDDDLTGITVFGK